MDPSKPVYEPTPEEIREATEKLQATWSDREECRRSGIDPDKEYEVPETCFVFGPVVKSKAEY